MTHPNVQRSQANSPLRVLLLTGVAGVEPALENELSDSRTELLIKPTDSEAGLLDALSSFRPEVVLADLDWESVSPDRALRVMRAAGYSTPLIVVADSFDEQNAVDCMRAGAEDLVVKSNLSRLRPAIDDALARREPLSRLSPRQREVMRLVALGHTMREIAERLGLSVKTVETHRSELVKRLGIRDVAGLVRYAVRVGLIPSEPARDAADRFAKK